MHAPDAPANQRRNAILDASVDVFLRFGFRKTAMDDVARAAGLSRQGLYLHFANKETLFRASVLRLIATTCEAGRVALARTDLPVVPRIAGAFSAVHGHAVAGPRGAPMGELLDAAAQLVGPALADMEAAFVRDVATALEESGVAARWALAGISAQALAGQLHATSVGLKHSVATAAEYDGRMTMAVRLVCEPPAA